MKDYKSILSYGGILSLKILLIIFLLMFSIVFLSVLSSCAKGTGEIETPKPSGIKETSSPVITATPFPTPMVPENPSWGPMTTAKYSEYDNYGKSVPDGQVAYYTPDDPDDLFNDKLNDRIIGYKDGKKIYELKLQNKNKSVLYPMFKDPGFPVQDIYKYGSVFNIGFLNGNLKKVLDEKYRNDFTYIYNDAGDLLTVNAGSYLFDSEGNILLDKTIYRFSGNRHGYADIIDTYNELHGLLNLKTGKIQIPCIYQRLVFLLKDTLFAETRIGEQQIIDINRKILLEIEELYEVFQQDSDYIPLNVDDKEGYIDRKGDWKIDAQYKAAYPFINDVAPVMIEENKYAFINKKNKKLKTISVSYLDQYTVNKKAVYRCYNNEKRVFEILDDKFNILIASENVYVYEKYGRILFEKEDKIGLYDLNTNKIIDTNIPYEKNSYNLCGEFIVSLDFVGSGDDTRGYYDVYNLAGEILFTKSQITNITPDDKYMWVCDDLYRGYIDNQGNWILKERRYTNISD